MRILSQSHLMLGIASDSLGMECIVCMYVSTCVYSQPDMLWTVRAGPKACPSPHATNTTTEHSLPSHLCNHPNLHSPPLSHTHPPPPSTLSATLAGWAPCRLPPPPTLVNDALGNGQSPQKEGLWLPQILFTAQILSPPLNSNYAPNFS